jgi:hypothetical protein
MSVIRGLPFFSLPCIFAFFDYKTKTLSSLLRKKTDIYI